MAFRRHAEDSVRGPMFALEVRPRTLHRCQKIDRTARVYAIGSSTMAGLLGPAMKKMLQGEDVRFRQWGKRSTGLARPDFHDWEAKVPSIAKRHKPDVWIVSLGTNDYQPVRLRNKRWIRMHTPQWRQVYASRVRNMLDLMTGPNRDRAVVWVGPTSYPGEASRKLGPLISSILRHEIDRFDGPVRFVDAFRATSNEKNRPLVRVRLPNDKVVKVRGQDGIHMTPSAVKALLAQPVVDFVRHCLK